MYALTTNKTATPMPVSNERPWLISALLNKNAGTAWRALKNSSGSSSFERM